MPQEPGERPERHPLSRLDAMRAARKDDSYHPPMPPLRTGSHIVSYLWEVGPGVGGQVLTHGELRAWQENVGLELEPWVIRMLRRLSSDFLAESSRAQDPQRAAPWGEQPTADWRVMQSALRRLASL